MQTTYFNYVPENDISKFKIKKKRRRKQSLSCVRKF